MRLGGKVALLVLPVTTLAVTLSDFKSEADTIEESDLPPSCLKVFKADISGCSPSDFTSESGCSTGCVAALQVVAEKVETACGDEGLEGTGIVTVFLEGSGPGAICRGAAASAGNTSAQSSAPESMEIASSTASAQSKSRSSSSFSSTATSTPSSASLSVIVTASSLAPTATVTGILVDTSSTAAPASTSTAGGEQRGGNDHSGQGSPFDTQGVPGGAMAAASISLTTMFLTAAAILHTAL